MEFKEMMQDFCSSLGLKDNKPDIYDVYRIAFDDMEVSFSHIPEKNQLAMLAEVGQVPSVERERFYQMLLESMFQNQANNEAVFSMNSDTETIFLHKILPLQHLELETFKKEVEVFVNTLEQWSAVTDNFRGAISEAASENTEICPGDDIIRA